MKKCQHPTSQWQPLPPQHRAMPAATRFPAINRPHARPLSTGISGSRQQLAATAPPPSGSRDSAQHCPPGRPRSPAPTMHPSFLAKPSSPWGHGPVPTLFPDTLHHIPSHTPPAPGADTIPLRHTSTPMPGGRWLLTVLRSRFGGIGGCWLTMTWAVGTPAENCCTPCAG